jgi:outer membrane lipoprotein-sorting protein
MPCTRLPAVAHPIRVVSRLTLALAAALPLVAQSSTLNEAFARLDKTAPQFKSVTADFQRDVYTTVIDDHEKDGGTIKARREKSHDTRMLIELSGADGKKISVDGGTLSVYTPKLRTEQVFDVRKGLVDQFLLLGFGASSADLKADYDATLLGTEKLGNETAWHLQLIPKSPDVLKNLKKAELWAGESSGLPLQEKLFTSASGDYQLVVYSNVILNPSLSDGALKLNLPKGVTVEHPRF